MLSGIRLDRCALLSKVLESGVEVILNLTARYASVMDGQPFRFFPHSAINVTRVTSPYGWPHVSFSSGSSWETFPTIGVLSAPFPVWPKRTLRTASEGRKARAT
jgi:hypothetical protein